MRSASMDLDSMMKNEGRIDLNTWSHRVMYASGFLHAFLRPTMTDEQYREMMNEASESKTGDKFDAFDRVKYGKILFKQDIKHLHENNMVFQESDDMVIDDQTEGKLEPEGSEVDEEVIE
jgi:hypothetical protein